jgi:rhodanese-related sulfurtransferase
VASEEAARDLAAMGYKNVRDYAEGKQDWLDAKLPVEGVGGGAGQKK